MGSNGGVLSVERSCRAADRAGRIGPGRRLHRRRRLCGRRSASTMSSPSTWAAPPPNARWSSNGRFAVESIYYAGGYVNGLPDQRRSSTSSRSASGGGSIAWLDRAAAGCMSARSSAGSMPGPACYGRGGTEPTVTDANLLLGRLDPRAFPRRRDASCDRGTARDGASQRIAGPLGYTGERRGARMADGMLDASPTVIDGRRPSSRSRSSTATIRATSCCSATAAAGRCTASRWRASCRFRP